MGASGKVNAVFLGLRDRRDRAYDTAVVHTKQALGGSWPCRRFKELKEAWLERRHGTGFGAMEMPTFAGDAGRLCGCRALRLHWFGGTGEGGLDPLRLEYPGPAARIWRPLLACARRRGMGDDISA